MTQDQAANLPGQQVRTMLSRRSLSLRETANALDLDTQRVLRLGRYLCISTGDQCLPPDVVTRARSELDCEQRYRMVLEWLLENPRG
jgi:hypothetical protein